MAQLGRSTRHAAIPPKITEMRRFPVGLRERRAIESFSNAVSTKGNNWFRFYTTRKAQDITSCLPESQAACEEMLEEVIGSLCDHFPGMFERKRRGSTLIIFNKETCEYFAFGPSNNKMEPLDIAAWLAMEDLWPVAFLSVFITLEF
ncbi:hypothetical protein V8E54_009636 [Elaphomyces granulatus]